MAKFYTHWCKNGCGKKVVSYRRIKDSYAYAYKCNKCETIFLKEDLIEMNPTIGKRR